MAGSRLAQWIVNRGDCLLVNAVQYCCDSGNLKSTAGDDSNSNNNNTCKGFASRVTTAYIIEG